MAWLRRFAGCAFDAQLRRQASSPSSSLSSSPFPLLRACYSSASAAGIGGKGSEIIENSGEENSELSDQLDKAVKNVRKLMRRSNGTQHEIMEVNKHGEVKRYTCTDLEVLKKVEDNSLHFRDLGLVNVDGARRQAELIVRDRSIILRLFQVHAIIQSDFCLFFGANRPHVELAGQLLKRQMQMSPPSPKRSKNREGGDRDREGIAEGVMDDFEYAFYRELAKPLSRGQTKSETRAQAENNLQAFLQSSEDVDSFDSFEQKALQCALTTSINRLNHQTGQIGMLVDIVLRDIGNDVESLRKVLPLKQKVEALRTEIESMLFVLTETLAQDEDMANMNLTWIDENQGARPSTQDHLEVEAILETSRREIQQIGRILVETNERIDDTREVLNISLDSQRNRILTLNLQTSLLTLSLTAIAVPAGILGMNIPLGWEEDPTAFPTVIRAMGMVGLCMYIIPVSYLYYGFFRTSKNRVKEVVALQNVVHDMDVVERTFYKMASKKGKSKQDFQHALSEATGRKISEAEMELICKAFDAKGDEFLQLETYHRIVEHAVSSKKKPA